jgi:hypothetical protein
MWLNGMRDLKIRKVSFEAASFEDQLAKLKASKSDAIC